MNNKDINENTNEEIRIYFIEDCLLITNPNNYRYQKKIKNSKLSEVITPNEMQYDGFIHKKLQNQLSDYLITSDRDSLNTYQFNCKVIFDHCTFNSHMVFYKNEFTKSAVFVNCTFNKKVIFKNSSFNKLDIRECKFNDISSFEDCEFNDISSFEDCKFNDIFSFKDCFKDCEFNDILSFKNCNFNSETKFDKLVFEHPIYFDLSQFNDFADFHATIFKKKVSFYRAIFKKVPNFSNTEFEDSLNMVNTNLDFGFSDLKKAVKTDFDTLREDRDRKLDENQEYIVANNYRDSFRIFKSNLLKYSNLLEASNYHKNELYCKEIELSYKQNKSIREIIDQCVLKFYRILSDHHTNLGRVFCLLMSIIGIYAMYLYFIGEFTKSNENNISNFYKLIPPVSIKEDTLLKSIINFFYNFVFFLVLYSLQKTARKNSIVPN